MITCVAVSPGHGGPVEDWLDGLGRAGWPTVLLREPTCPDAEGLLALARARVPEVWLHARTPGAAALARARGLRLHVPGDAPAPGGDWSASAHGEDEVDARLAAGAAAVIWSPVWDPTSKPPARPPLGPDRFLAHARGRPVFALGGVDAARARWLRRAGAAGFCVLGGLGPAAERAPELLAAAR